MKNETRLYIKASEKLRKELREFIIKDKSYESFSTENKISQREISRWICGKRGIPLNIIIRFSNSIGRSIEEIVHNEFLSFERSSYIFKFNKEISIFECNFLGWFLSEGHMEKDGRRISISQHNKECLVNIKKLIETNFGLTNLRIEKDKEAWKLRISNAAFCNYLSWRYNLDFGKKCRKVKIPDIIFHLSQEHKYSFLASYIEGDGCFSHYWRSNQGKKYKVPRIFITSSSFGMLNDLQKIFQSINLTSRITLDKPTTKINILKAGDCSKLAFFIYPYLVHPERKRRLVEIFQNKGILNAIRIGNSKGLLNKLRIHLKLERKDLPKYLMDNLGYKAAKTTIMGWLNGTYRPPLSIILHTCKVLDKNYFDYLPKEYAYLLYVQKLISKENLYELRKTVQIRQQGKCKESHNNRSR